jgi:hypothetical protein
MATTNRLTAATRASLPNGKFAKHVNGHAKDAAPHQATPDPAHDDLAPRVRARAAADEDHGVSLRASDPPAAAPPAASTDRAVFAAAARDSKPPALASGSGASLSDEARQAAPKDVEAKRDDAKRGSTKNIPAEPQPPVPPAKQHMPDSAEEYAEAVHSQADLVDVGRRLLNSQDERILRAVWQHLLNMRYGRDAAPDDGVTQVNVDVSSPKFDPDVDVR